jgi:hypothetical protein
MENVPAMLSDLEREMEGDLFKGSFGVLPIPSRFVLDSAEFGAPQTRRRLFSGNFPAPHPTSSYADTTVLTLRTILDHLPAPSASAIATQSRIPDPVYPSSRIPVNALRDHFEDSRWRLSEEELESSRYWKQSNPVYGKMSFPDSLERPSRTITATRTRGSRSTIVIPDPSSGPPGLRTLTLRECASAQGFPLTYQFWGSSVSEKDFLVGNAVPPPVARAIGFAILRAESLAVPRRPLMQTPGELPPIVIIRHNGPRRFSMARRFRGIVPVDWRHDHRVELDNEFSSSPHGLGREMVPRVSWKTRVYLGYATEYRCYQIDLPTGMTLARSAIRKEDPKIPETAIIGLLLETLRVCLNGFPDGLHLQARWSGRETGSLRPETILGIVARIVGKSFPASDWSGVRLPKAMSDPILSPNLVAKGKQADRHQSIELSVRLLASTVSLAAICERLNHGPSRLATLLGAITSTKGLTSKRVTSQVTRMRNLPRLAPQQTALWT